MKPISTVLQRIAKLAQVETTPAMPSRVSIFQSRVVMISIASALTLAQPSIEKFMVEGKFDRTSLYKLGQSLAMIVGVVAYRYSVDDTRYYTPEWMPGKNKGEDP
jgi:hypothetical protein